MSSCCASLQPRETISIHPCPRTSPQWMSLLQGVASPLPTETPERSCERCHPPLKVKTQERRQQHTTSLLEAHSITLTGKGSTDPVTQKNWTRNNTPPETYRLMYRRNSHIHTHTHKYKRASGHATGTNSISWVQILKKTKQLGLDVRGTKQRNMKTRLWLCSPPALAVGHCHPPSRK